MISKERLEIFKDTQHVSYININWTTKFNLLESMEELEMIKKIDVTET